MLTTVMLLIVGGLVTAFVAKRMLAREDVVVRGEAINIPMALTDLKPGTVITDAHIGLGPALPSQLDREVLRTSRVVVGRIVRNPIVRAQPIRTSDLYAPGERPPLKVAEDMRAVSVALADETALVDGLIVPGQFADVHFTPSGDYGERGGMVMTLFKGVKVLAINRSQSSTSAAGRGANSVTLELTPAQANMLLLARDRGDINLTYRPDGPGSGGVAVGDENRAFLDEILGLAAPFMTEIYAGAGRTANTFEGGRLLRSDSSGSSRTSPPSSSPNRGSQVER
jgi:pilus assembly protein CpaB